MAHWIENTDFPREAKKISQLLEFLKGIRQPIDDEPLFEALLRLGLNQSVTGPEKEGEVDTSLDERGLKENLSERYTSLWRTLHPRWIEPKRMLPEAAQARAQLAQVGYLSPADLSASEAPRSEFVRHGALFDVDDEQESRRQLDLELGEELGPPDCDDTDDDGDDFERS